MKKIVKKNFEKNKGTLKKSKADMVEINVTPWNRTGKIVQVHKRPPTLLHYRDLLKFCRFKTFLNK